MLPLSPLRLRPLSLAFALLPLLGGCAEERAPINRVQPNALEKAFFVGALAEGSDDPEFYYRPTVVDVDFGAAQSGLFTASYAQTLVRVRWEVSEEALLARLAYDRIDGTSGAVEEGTEGQIVAAFAIQSHFDIRRSYNPQTGEELNVIEENASDRPWYEREFMRVDWSMNLITAAYELDTLSALKLYTDAPLSYEPIAYSVEDPSHPDRPFFSPDDGYFDVTNKVYATPELLDTPYGVFTACTFSADIFGGTFPEGNCNPAEVKLRLSFKRVGDTDYEPVHWDGTRMDMFGMFTTATRLGYDRNYGIVDENWFRFASRHNIWERSHARDADGQLIACNTPETTYITGNPEIDVDPFDGTHDECAAAGVGSRCDRYTQACTIPYRERETATIPMYYGLDSDPTLWETSRDVTAEWDSALRHAAQTARYTECIRTGGGVVEDVIDACKVQYPIGLEDALAAVPEILVFCHNPVETTDHPACGTPGLVARVGDLRYHIVNIIQDPQVPSPWGILADAVDPLTGEVVAASINVWNAVTDMQAQTMVDMLRWYNGELSNQDVISGGYVSSGAAARARRSPGWTSPPIMSASEASGRLLSLDRSLVPEATVRPPKLDQRSLVSWAIQQTNQRYGDQALGSGDAGIQQRFERAKATGIESALVTQPYLELGGGPPAAALDEIALDRVSPLRGNFLRFKAELEQRQHVEHARSGRCMLEAPEPSSVVDLGRVLEAKFPTDADPETEGVQYDEQTLFDRNEKWRDFIRRQITHGVLSHEMGHSMGLRHVFTSSFDAMNYRPQYWQLRTRDGAETSYCGEPTDDGSDCIGPRWRDPVTRAERDGLIYTWQQTSVMDYPGDLTQEMIGLGAYDRAAIRFAYADVADIWDDPAARCVPSGNGGRSCTRAGDILQDRLDSFGGIGGPWYGGSQWIHYSRLHNELNLIRNCEPADLTPPADWDWDRDGNWIPELDGRIVNGTVCDGPPIDHLSYSDLELASAGFVQVGTFAGQPRKFDTLGRVRRPYMFGSDEYADYSNTSVHRNDSGADAYEQAVFYISEYEDRHIWDNYRRNRTNFTLTRAIGRSYGRFLNKLKNLYKGYAFLHEIYSGAGAVEALLDDEQGDGTLRGPALATSLTFDHFVRVLTRPSAGAHVRAADESGSPFGVLRSADQILTPDEPLSLIVPDGSTGIGSNVWLGGRPLYNGLDGSKGYWAWDYQLFAGSYYDKTQVVELLTESTSSLADQYREDLSDARYRNVSMATIYPDGVRRLVANALTQDADLLGWRAAGRTTNDDNISILRDDFSAPSRPLGYRVWWPESGIVECWPGSSGNSCAGYDDETLDLGAAPETSIALDPEVGWEVQKFIIFWSLAYLPDNWKRDWVDMMRLWVVGTDPDPQIPEAEQIAWRDPVSGQLYIAHRYGTEDLAGKVVQRGIAARTIEWMNVLTAQAYEITATNPLTGELTVARHADDSACPEGKTACAGQPVEISREYSLRATNYKSVLDFMRQVTATFGFYDPAWRGLYQ